MKHYIDITLLPSDDIGVHFLWSKVMMQVHLALVEIQNAEKKVPVAVSFPQYREKSSDKSAFIGTKLRLLASDKSDLQRLNIDKWLNRLDDYVHVKAISNVPNNVAIYENFFRRTKAGSPDKHIRRRMKRHNESLEQASEYFKGYSMKQEDRELPFIQMKSLESMHDFNMSIVRTEVEESDGPSFFNTYGLSSKSALPKF